MVMMMPAMVVMVVTPMVMMMPAMMVIVMMPAVMVVMPAVVVMASMMMMMVTVLHLLHQALLAKNGLRSEGSRRCRREEGCGHERDRAEGHFHEHLSCSPS
jgi:hypothetical protein